MEIAKEKFIETFKKECEKAVLSSKLELFRDTSSGALEIIEILSENNQSISFCAMKIPNNDNEQYNFYGRILFDGFVDYQSIVLTAEEFNSLSECFEQSLNVIRMAVRNNIITNGEIALAQILQ